MKPATFPLRNKYYDILCHLTFLRKEININLVKMSRAKIVDVMNRKNEQFKKLSVVLWEACSPPALDSRRRASVFRNFYLHES